MTWLVLWHTTLPLLAGLLCGRYLRHQHLDKVERDAWDDGFREALRLVLLGSVNADDAQAREQAVPDGWPGWN
jgi:hypothetical protein